MINAEELQAVYESKKGLHLSLLKTKNGEKMFCKKIGYNFLSVSSIMPPVYDVKTTKRIEPIVNEICFEKKYYEAILLLMSGKLYLTKWLSYGDDFNVTAGEMLSFYFPFDQLSCEDINIIHRCFIEYEKRQPNVLQFKLNSGKNVGTFNTSLLWDITDVSDAVFLKYIADNPQSAKEQIENHIAKCVITGKS